MENYEKKVCDRGLPQRGEALFGCQYYFLIKLEGER